MTQVDQDPNPRPPIGAEWEGSRIEIHNLPEIIEEASAGKVNIFDRSDFPANIERAQVSAEVVDNEGEDALRIETVIQLDRTQELSASWLNERFKLLAPQTRHNPDYQKRPPFLIQNRVFPNTYILADEQSGSRFVLWVDSNRQRVTISNDASLSVVGDSDDQPKKELKIDAPPLHTIASEEQIKSLMKATAMVADFVNAFSVTATHNPGIRGIPLSREYVVGKERRRMDVQRARTAGSIAKTAIKGIVPPPETSTGTGESQSTSDVAWLAELGIETPVIEETLTLDDVGGMEKVKEVLREVALSFTNPEIMEKWGTKRPQGILLYGEPGTGKTMLTQALANEIDAELLVIQSTDIYEKWLGNSEQRIKELFSGLRKVNKRTIVFFDELESIVGITDSPSPGGADNARNAVAGIFKQELNTLATDNPNILVVAATNDRDKINPSLIRTGRFDYQVYVPMPDQVARQSIVGNILAKSITASEAAGFAMFGDDLNTAEIAHETDGMSGSDIAEIFRRIKMRKAMEEARLQQAPEPITQADITSAIRIFRLEG